MSAQRLSAPGPFVASQLRDGDPYELSNGHPVYCAPTGQRGSKRNLTGGAALETDPKVASAGVDLGVSTEPGMLRAPDVAVGPISDGSGWSKSAPPLALEYADVGQDEGELVAKIKELLEAGTQYVWVARLDGTRRVEVHEPRKAMRVLGPDGILSAPGILQNDVPVPVLFDRDAAHEATLRNLLQRQGYDSLISVREEGREEGRKEGRLAERAVILAKLVASGMSIEAAQRLVEP
jgi:Putative restriction endonuclease